MISFFVSVILYSCMFIYGSTGEILIEKSGHLNLGIPGIMCLGAVGGCAGSLAYFNSLNGTNIDTSMMIFVGVMCCLLMAGAFGLLYGFMTITLKCNQNVTGLSITTLGIGVFNFWLKYMGAEGESIKFYAIKEYYIQPLFGEGSGTFYELFLGYGPLVYLAFIIAIVMAIYLSKTKKGLNLRAIGENPGAADSTGINVNKYKYLACTVGSAIAGLGGLFCLMEITRGSLLYPIDAMGWLAVALVIFSIWKPGFAIIGSLIFATLFTIPGYAEIPLQYKELIDMLPYLATIIVLIITSILNKKEFQPPQSLGNSYFREDR